MERLAVAPLAAEAWARRESGLRAPRAPAVRRSAVTASTVRCSRCRSARFTGRWTNIQSRQTPARYVADHVIPDIADATVASAPPAGRGHVPPSARGRPAGFVSRWLAGEPQEPVDQYLAARGRRARAGGAGTSAGAACRPLASENGCPRCGGLPQVSYLTESGEALVSSPPDASAAAAARA